MRDYSKGYTKGELKTVLLKYMGPEHIKAAGIPASVNHAAEIFFVDKIPESEDTELIRQAYIDLHRRLGRFNYRD